MSTTQGLARAATPAPARGRERRSRLNQQAGAGWLFVLPMVVVLGVFLFLPVLMAAWVSVSDWGGRGSPWGANVNFVGARNYVEVLGGKGLAARDFGTAMRNNLYYVILVVPLQTAISLGLAFMVNKRALRGKGFFRTAFYFPSVTSTVAITVLWLFLFSASGAVNAFLSWFSITGPNWFADPRGLIHLILGGGEAPAALSQPGLFGIIVLFTVLQRFILGGGDRSSRRQVRAEQRMRARLAASGSVGGTIAGNQPGSDHDEH